MKRDERPRVELSQDTGRYVARCPKCFWVFISKDKEGAKDMLQHHTSTRKHKTNLAAPTRFIV